MQETFTLNLLNCLLILSLINIILAGLSLRIGGQLLKGPYLPETIEGLSKTTKAVLGKTYQ